MTVNPKVYKFAPGAKTGAAIITGVKSVMDSPLGTHHWDEHAYTPGSTITLKDKLTGLKRLRLVAVTSGTPSPTVDCYYSHDGGVTESNKCWMSGGTTTYNIDNNFYGMSTDVAYVIEIEDAITIVCGKGSTGGTSLVANSMSMGVHAGRILSAHNKSDSSQKIGEEGLMCGQLMVYNGSTWSMLSNLTGSGGGVSGGAQNAIWMGTAYVPVHVAVSGTAADYRDKRTAATVPLLENVGDAQSIERLTPFAVQGPNSGVLASGHTSYTRYIRARKYGNGDVPPASPPVDNLTVLQSAGDPDIGWRHNYAFVNSATTINLIHIWCTPGQEIVVS